MKKVTFTILSVKLALFLLIFCTFSLLPFSQPGYYFNFHFPPQAKITLQTAFSTWDAQHYLFLAQKGYSPGIESDRFFPLLPSVVHLFSPIFGFFFSGLFVANMFSFVGCVYFYLFVKDYTKNEKTAYLSLLLLLIFPTGFYFSLIYSESIFLGILMPLFYYLYKRRFLYVFLFSFLLPLVRPTGIFVLVPLFVFVVADYWKDIRQQKKFFLSKAIRFRLSLFLLVPPLLGEGLYFLIMYHTTGNPMTGLASQHNVVGNWQLSAILHPQIFVQNLLPYPLALHGFTNSILDRLFFLGFLSVLPLLWKKTDPTLFFYCCSMGLVPFFGSFMSYTRYVLLAVPIFIALGKVFSEEKGRKLLFPYIYGNLLLQTLFCIMHVLNYWVA